MRPELRDILLSVSLDDTFTVAKAAYLSGNEQAPFLLSRYWEGGGLFAREGECVRWNPVLREAARQTLKDASISRYYMLYRRYGLWYEREGDLVRALEYYLSARYYEGAFALLDGPGGGEIAEQAPMLAVRTVNTLDLRDRARYPYAMLAGAYAKLLHTAPDEGGAELDYIWATLSGDERLAGRAQICGELAWIEAFAAMDAAARETYIREARKLLGGKPSRLFPEEMLARLERRLPFADAARSAAETLEACGTPKYLLLAQSCRAALTELTPEEAYVRRAYAKGRTLQDIADELGLDKDRTHALVASVYRHAGVTKKRELVKAERRSAV